MDFDSAKRVFEKYLDGYDRENDKVRLKIVHTYGVAAQSTAIAERMRLSAEDREIYDSLSRKKKLVVYNKTDLGEGIGESSADIKVSAKTGENIESLREKMFSLCMEDYKSDGAFLI